MHRRPDRPGVGDRSIPATVSRPDPTFRPRPEDVARGSDGVPGEGALREAWCAGDGRHRHHRPGRGRGGGRGRGRSEWRPVVVKAQVKTGGRGKAGGVKLAQDAQDAVEKAGEILGMDIKGHTVHRVLVAPAAEIAEEYYFSFLLDRANRDYLCIASTEGGVEIEETAVENPDAVAKVSIDPLVGVDDAKADEIVAATGFPAEVAEQAKQVIQQLWDVFVEGGRHPGRGQPARAAGRRIARGARRQGLARRERRLPSRGPRWVRASATRRTRSRRGQGEGPQLRQARRRGRHHRQRRRPGHVHPRRRRLRRREARRRQAGQLPRHRWWRQRRGDGRRARHHPRRPAGQGGVRQRLRRHHRLRRGRQRHRRTRWRSSATRPTSRSSSASTATTSRRVAGSSPRRPTRW